MEEITEDLPPYAIPSISGDPGSSVTYCTDEGLLTVTMPRSGRLILPLVPSNVEDATKRFMRFTFPDADEMRILRSPDGRIAVAIITFPEPEAA